MKFSKFKTNEDKETEGVWIDFGEGLRLLIARSGNVKYRRTLARLTKPHQHAFKSKTIEASVVEDITLKAVAKHILLGWENLQDDDGKDIEYSQSKAEELLREAPDFFEQVLEIAQDRSLYQDQQDKDDLEN